MWGRNKLAVNGKKQQPQGRIRRIFAPGREFATGKDFAELLRESELGEIYSTPMW